MMLTDTSMFTNVKIIYKDDDSKFAIATGNWNKEPDLLIGMRWYGKEGDVGYPQTFGKGQWFILPANISNIMLYLINTLKMIKNVV